MTRRARGSSSVARFYFHPEIGDFTLKKSHSSDVVKNMGEKFNGNEDGFVNNGYFKGASFFSSDGGVQGGGWGGGERVVKGRGVGREDVHAACDFAVVNCRGLRVPPQEAVVDEVDAVVVGRRGDRRAECD
ncbi:hypothetical protein CASFOL_027725 [Castilleja foliolosa]|uniref:Uncharacterized protein n=1 Tax=Castilleja foliolosa TaxID=1961234 RepID=A0ABD3CGM0_9LAMI